MNLSEITIGLSVKNCGECENNLRCKECSLPNQVETLKKQLDEMHNDIKTAEEYAFNLKCEKEELISESNRQKADNELLKENNSLLTEAGQEWQKRYETAKAEAIKEFAERLKEKHYEGQGYYSVFTIHDVNNLVKEMAGDTE